MVDVSKLVYWIAVCNVVKGLCFSLAVKFFCHQVAKIKTKRTKQLQSFAFPSGSVKKDNVADTYTYPTFPAPHGSNIVNKM